MQITLIAGARPNFVKIAPVIHAIKKAQHDGKNITYRLVHTGQHYDQKMSETFFSELNIPQPDVNLGCGGGSQAEQTAAIMVAFEKDLILNPTDLVMVVGDVTSTMACSIVAKKLNTKAAHIEAGIRSWDLTMPEEINRMVTDALCDYFFTTTEVANQNLRNAGANSDRIFFVGNVMIDTLLANMDKFRKPTFFDEKQLMKGKYIVLTLHRPGNVDGENHFKILLEAIIEASCGVPVVFPVHPRTAKIIDSISVSPSSTSMQSLILTEPLGYHEFNYLVKNSMAVITDSGGITEETTVMGIPCITIRNNTERPETCTIGTNELIGTDPAAIKPALEKLFGGNWKKGGVPELWDGKTAERIVEILSELK
ncbi:MAG: UDP-N-acetylglucosamine 2-epimerase (non-hydrolyzing) [Paludibacter sp.]|nr:UDP-N-acetylglucosamine 2-epimerase (non-hydrolyzing) [Paludibacter sp.]